jgi:hypothetical protein
VGVGATRTLLVHDAPTLERHLAEPLEGYVVQALVEGSLTSFDGIVDRDGALRFAGSFVYRAGVAALS